MTLLPPDYESLSVEGQRLARVAAIKRWTSPDLSPPEREEAFVGGIHLLDNYYLHDDEDADFQAMFYDEPPLPRGRDRAQVQRDQ